ncbi:MAG: transaldolase [Actinomycetia bacterium]|nr:transaldolase [Actinomycetes bacterium]
MARLHDLYGDYGQSPWLDNLRRGWIASGDLQAWIDRGVRGLTSNPTIFAKAMIETDDYDHDLAELVGAGSSINDAYWDLVVADINQALGLLRGVHDSSGGEDGYVSVEVSPALANDEVGTIAAARMLDDRIAAPNLYIKVPATVEGVPATKVLISEGRSVNVTLIFSLQRYQAVMDAYLEGLEANPAADLSSVSSVASFFVSRVDVEVDGRLAEIGSPEAMALRGKAAIAQAQLAYQRFNETFSGPRWDALVSRGARLQRPLWASTSTKDPSYPDTLYVDTLIGPNTINTLPDSTLAAFEDHGSLARTVDADPQGPAGVIQALFDLGIDIEDVAAKLEVEGVDSFASSFDEVLATLGERAGAVASP